MAADLDFSSLLRHQVDHCEAEVLYNITYGNVLFDRLMGRPRLPPPDRHEYVEAYVAARVEERRLDSEVGPILGPGRVEWSGTRIPYDNYRRIRDTMPGKRPGVFVRG